MFPFIIEILSVVCDFLDARSLMVVAQVCRTLRIVSLHAFSLDSRAYFRRDWLEESVELALPSNVLALSVSADESHFYVCARGYDAADAAVLYIHDVASGQRSFEDLPLAFSEEMTEVWFEGPHFLVCGSRSEANAIFDCERGLELRLLSRGRNFRASSDGRSIGALFGSGSDADDVFVVQPMGPSERQSAVDQAQEAWRKNYAAQRHLRQSFDTSRRATRPGSPTSLRSHLLCPYYEVSGGGCDGSSVNSKKEQRAVSQEAAPRGAFLSIPASATALGSPSCDSYVATGMLVTVSRRVGEREVLVEAFFHPVSTSQVADITDFKKASVKLPMENRKCSVAVVERGTVPGQYATSSLRSSPGSMPVVVVLDMSAMRVFTWHPLTGTLAQTSQTYPSPSQRGPSVPHNAHRHNMDSHHPQQRLPRTIECEAMFVLLPRSARQKPLPPNDVVAAPPLAMLSPCTVLTFLSVERVGLGAAEKRQYFLNFLTLDMSLSSRLLLKGKSLLAPLPSSSDVILAMWTASLAAPHPLFEATECGIGTMIRFGQLTDDVVRKRAADLERKSRRMAWIIWTSVVVMGLSLLSTVLSLVYNGWWLHMQFLFSS